MTHELRQRWDARYRNATPQAAAAAEVLRDNLHLLPARGSALDLASGLGGNAQLLARHGLATEAWDLSPVAIDALNAFAGREALSLKGVVRDVVAEPPAAGSFDVIVVSRFLERSLCQHLEQALRPGGLLFYQTFTRLKVQGLGPANPEFLLGQGELLRLFPHLDPVVYREERDLGDHRRGFRDQALLVALRPERANDGAAPGF
ncbi:MAG: class I SAM-dependent methyltransferase [Ectothiorhodospiraceae bacterium]|nr:class I SAM-dependent methyltransferase [Ectothiorhodospiraceae bacterium]MCH8506886.1 class I SAM-dependent methyltransferase [Ectothiorhodospiraceae bacterium]